MMIAKKMKTRKTVSVKLTEPALSQVIAAMRFMKQEFDSSVAQDLLNTELSGAVTRYSDFAALTDRLKECRKEFAKKAKAAK